MRFREWSFDARVLGDANVWVKPLKFSVSFALYFATLALVVERMGEAARAGWVLRIALGVAVVAMIGEMGYLFLSAGAGGRVALQFLGRVPHPDVQPDGGGGCAA